MARMSTRMNLSPGERRLLISAGKGDSAAAVKAIANFLREHGDTLDPGRRQHLRRSTHLTFDEEDWQTIEQWIARHGRRRVNHLLTVRTTKKELMLEVARLLATPNSAVPRWRSPKSPPPPPPPPPSLRPPLP